MRLRTRFLILIFLAILVTGVSIISVARHVAIESLTERIGSHLWTVAKLRAEEIEILLTQHEYMTIVLAQENVLRDLVSGDNDHARFLDRAHKKLAKVAASHQSISRIRLLEKNGMVVVSSSGDVGSDAADEEAFLRGKEGSYLSDLHRSLYARHAVLVTAEPIPAHGGVLGVIVIEFDEEDGLFHITTERTGMGETGEIYLVNQEGYFITPARFLDDVVLTRRIDPARMRDIADIRLHSRDAAMSEVGLSRNYQDRDVLCVHRHIPEMGWTLVAEMGTREAFAPVRRLTQQAGVLFGAILLVGAALSVMLSGTIIRPIRKLHEGTEEIIKGNLDYKVGTPRRDEIGQLSRAFDRMAANLKESKREIEESSRMLAVKVEDKTAELQQQFKRSEEQRIATLNILQDLDEANESLRREIEERKKAEDALHESERQLLTAQKMEAVGQLAGGVAHDFNNLLTAIQGYAQFAMMNLGENDLARRDIREIQRNAVRATDLTRQLLLFSRGHPMEKSPLDPNALLEEMWKMLSRLVEENVALRVELEEAVWTIKADLGNIEQVIMNLVVNARDAMPKGGEIVIRTENILVDDEYCAAHAEAKQGNFVCISVEDSGLGMDEETRSHVFEPFFTTKGPGTGTGLGLAVVYGIVKQHDGWVEVESMLGQGARFRVFVPAVAPDVVEKSQIEVSPDMPRGSGERILVVEDEEAVLEFAVLALSEHGYVALPARSRKDAFEIFEREGRDFDLVFSDVVLPDGNGPRLVRELQELEPGIGVILTSGYTDEKAGWETIRESGYLYIQKPYSLSDLLWAMRETLEKTQAK